LKPSLAITIGDFNGIGPEVALKAAVHPLVRTLCTPVLVGPVSVFEQTAGHCRLRLKFEKTSLLWSRRSARNARAARAVQVIDAGDGIGADIRYGTPTKASGRSAGVSLERAVELCTQGKLDALVTSPSSKEALNMAGYNFPGQTEMIALLSHSQQVAMMLVSEVMRVGLVTIHTALRNVASQISKEKILEKIVIIEKSLSRDFRIKKPKLAVLSLNPHAGEKGLLGTEDDEVTAPAIAEARTQGIRADGPFSADAFFGKHTYTQYDAIVAMYHDQGLIPLKMSSFETGVNFSAGLKIVRTSPDHGTAYDIAGKNKANISSTLEAVKLAIKILRNRRAYDASA
jgi:4-hydroxythreonine-4-phosphate dehydrogenase